MVEPKQIKEDCPYCHTKDVAFTIRCYGEKVHRPHAFRWANLTDTFAVCGRCDRAVVVTFVDDGRQSSDVIIAPSPPQPPAHLPDNIRNFFQQGMDNLSENFDAAGAMFRKSLDVGLKDKFPEIGGTLSERIDKAVERQRLTPELGGWAHQIRLDGNEASHGEEPFSKEDSQRLSSFTELVLLYLYTLPAMLEEAKVPREPKLSTHPPKHPQQVPDIKSLRGGRFG